MTVRNGRPMPATGAGVFEVQSAPTMVTATHAAKPEQPAHDVPLRAPPGYCDAAGGCAQIDAPDVHFEIPATPPANAQAGPP